MTNKYVILTPTPEGEPDRDIVIGYHYGKSRNDAVENCLKEARENEEHDIMDADPIWAEQTITDEQRDAIKLLVASASGEAQPGGSEMEEAIETLHEMSAEW